jgi:hypothetical protein
MLHRLAPAVVVAAVVATTARTGGAYLPSTWGWIALGPALAAVTALALRADVRLERPAAAFLLLLTALVGWTALSALWSDSVPRTALEVERDLVYLAAVLAVAVLPRARGATTYALLASVVAVGGAALATRLWPARYGFDTAVDYRLARPLGYWNGLGAFAAMGVVLAVGVVADAQARTVVRSAAAAASVVLTVTIFFTLSRGAWLALAAGLLVALAVARERGTFAVAAAGVLAPCAAAVALAARAHELTRAPTSLGGAVHQGHLLALELVAVALGAALLAPISDRVRIPAVPRLRRRAVAPLAVACAVAGAVLSVLVGGRVYDGFRRSEPYDASLHERLFTFSGHGRTAYWDVAAREYAAHPLLGSGAGTYSLYWTRNRPIGVGAQDAHNLYLESLAELGPVGFVLLLAALAAPFTALPRRARFSAPLAGAYAVFLIHAAGDWDWELPTVTLVGLLCGALLARSGPELRVPRSLLVPALALAAAAAVAHVGNTSLATARDDVRAGKPRHALAAARRARTLAPWSAEAWDVTGAGELLVGERARARASFRAAVRDDPQDWIHWYELAAVSSGPGRRLAAARVHALNPLAPRLPP